MDLVLNDKKVNTGITDILINAINTRWSVIQDLNSLMVNLNEEGYEEMTQVIADIIETDNANVGKLEQLVELISPNLNNIADGKQEVIDTLDEVSVVEALSLNEDVIDNLPEDDEEDYEYYLSYYEEFPIHAESDNYSFAGCRLIDSIGFPTYKDAVDTLASMYDELIKSGYEKIADDFYINRSKYVGDDAYYKVESKRDLGSDEIEKKDM